MSSIRQINFRKQRPTYDGLTMIELVVVATIIGILLSLVLPALQQVRDAARNIQCQSNMRQMGLALHSFHEVFRVFPASGWTKQGPGNPAGKYVGWRPLILSFVEQENLGDKYNFEVNWWEGSNLSVASIPVRLFQCPSSPTRSAVLNAVAKAPRPAIVFNAPPAPTDYEAIMGVQPQSVDPVLYNSGNRFSAMHRNSSKAFRDVIDGATNTIMLVECSGRPDVYRLHKLEPNLSNDQGIGWADSEGAFSLDLASIDGTLESCTPSKGCIHAINRRNDNEPFSLHRGGANILFVDGHVQFINESVDYLIFAALCTADAGETVSEFAY